MESMLWALIYVSVFYFMVHYGRHPAHHTGGKHGVFVDDGNILADLQRAYSHDPVCGRAIASDAGYTRAYSGREYHFCSRTCRMLFEQNPSRYLIEKRKAD
jgi:YHS domain-containing protein